MKNEKSAKGDEAIYYCKPRQCRLLAVTKAADTYSKSRPYAQ